MKGGFNKILRNIVAGSADTEYEKVSPISPNTRFRGIKLTWFYFTEAYESNIPSRLERTKGKACDL